MSSLNLFLILSITFIGVTCLKTERVAECDVHCGCRHCMIHDILNPVLNDCCQKHGYDKIKNCDSYDQAWCEVAGDGPRKMVDPNGIGAAAAEMFR